MKPLIDIENEETAIQQFNAALTHEQTNQVIIGDVSGSMSDIVKTTGYSKFDTMRNCVLRVVSTLQNAAVIMFADITERITSFDAVNTLAPEFGRMSMRLGGGTALHTALREAAKLNPEHLVVITDGQPNRPDAALAIARTMLCRIDVYYCGNGSSDEVQFCRDLAQFGGEAIIDPSCVTMLETVKLFLTDQAIAA